MKKIVRLNENELTYLIIRVISETYSTNLTDIPQKNLNVLQTAEQQKGVPYKWGGQSPKGFDCSGLVSYVTGLGRTNANGYFTEIPKIKNPKELKPGDLIFFGKTKSSPAHHIGIIKELDDNGNVKKMIHARGKQYCPGNKPVNKNGQTDCVVEETSNIQWYGNVIGYGRVG
jgi:hypothetical protein